MSRHPLGEVFLSDFDRGVVEGLGATLLTRTVDESTRQSYVVDVSGVSGPSEYGNKVPVFFVLPEEVFQPERIPCFAVRRGDLTPAFGRQAWYGWQKEAAPDANALTVKISRGTYRSGYDKYTVQWVAAPFDIQYDVHCLARYQLDAQKLLKHALALYHPPGFALPVMDSLSQQRTYEGVEVSITSLSELADVAERFLGWSVSFSVYAELDMREPFDVDAVTALPDVGMSVL